MYNFTNRLIAMEQKPHFEIIFVPKAHGNVIARLEAKLKSQDEMREEVQALLAKHDIKPTKIFITKVDEGRGSNKLGDMFEGFTWRKYWGKVRGIKSGWLRDKVWKTDFYVYVLYGAEKDGIMFTTEGETEVNIKSISHGLYERILASMQKYGPIPWNRVTRVGTVQ